MTTVRAAAVQGTYVLMDREATIDRVAELTAAAAAGPSRKRLDARDVVVRRPIASVPAWPPPVGA
jgi:hypothetical protein